MHDASPPLKDERVRAAQVLSGPRNSFSGDRARLIEDLQQAVLTAKIIAYVQGFMLLR